MMLTQMLIGVFNVNSVLLGDCCFFLIPFCTTWMFYSKHEIFLQTNYMHRLYFYDIYLKDPMHMAGLIWKNLKPSSFLPKVLRVFCLFVMWEIRIFSGSVGIVGVPLQCCSPRGWSRMFLSYSSFK
jgi:hypothetical protein